LESDQHNPKKKNQQEETLSQREREKKDIASTALRKKGMVITLLGYSGRTA
jgi:hypothetical protein